MPLLIAARRLRWVLAACCLSTTWIDAGSAAQAQTPSLAEPVLHPAGVPELEALFARLARSARGRVGIGALHIESGRSAWHRADEAYPMASTFKIPIAIQFLQRVQDGESELDGLVEIVRGDLHPGSGDLPQIFEGERIERSRRWLLEKMLTISDNSAADRLLLEAGGAAQVTQHMRQLGFEGIRVDRSTLHLIADWLGISELPPEREVDPETFRRLYEDLSPEARQRAEQAFDQDPRDTATPRDMTRLLARLHRGELLDAERTQILLDVMSRCQTGAERIVANLPPGTAVAHKTGSIGTSTNDFGIVRLPEGHGHLALTVLIKQSAVDSAERERTIAKVARAAYDYFLAHPTDPSR